MEILAQISFGGSMFAIVYTWFLYPMILFIISRFKQVYVKRGEINPNVTLIIIVHNEEKVIKKRIKDALALDYPREKLEIIVASDGSTDKTDVIVESMSKEDNRIKLFKTEGGGKSFTQNKVIPYAKGEIIVLTDAQTMFHKDAVKSLTHNFADKAVGCVSGQLVLVDKYNSISEGQSFYWKFEMLLRRLESRIGIMHTASGGVMALRKNLFKTFDNKYGDDCIIPLDIIAQGYRVIHEDNAVAYDTFPSTIEGELKTRIRMTLRNITGTFSKFHLLNPFRFTLISVSILSHKIFRWLTPYFMIVLFISNCFLFKESFSYKITLYCQLIFYFFGVVGYLAERNSYRIPIASQAFSFLLANIGFFFGVLKALFGQKIVAYRN